MKIGGYLMLKEKLLVSLIVIFLGIAIGCNQPGSSSGKSNGNNNDSSSSDVLTITVINTTTYQSGTLKISYGVDDGDSSNLKYLSDSKPKFPKEIRISDYEKDEDFSVHVYMDSNKNGECDDDELGAYTDIDTTLNKTGTVTFIQPDIVDADQFEKDNKYIDAKSIEIDSSQERTLHNYEDEDYIKFSVIKGRTYTIEAAVLAANRTDTVMYLYNSNKELLTENDDIENNPDPNKSDLGSKIEYKPDFYGDCYIKIIVYGNELESQGAYTLSVSD